MDYLYAHYTLYKWIDESKHGGDTVGTLENFLIYPVFQRYCRYFLNQIHRLTDFSLLTYAVGFDDLDSNFRDRPLLNCIHYLVPVSPRRMPDFDPKFIEESCFPPNSVTETKHVFSLFVSMVRLAGLKRIEVNTRIVVIGTGDTAMGFLETLVCGSGPDLLVSNNFLIVYGNDIRSVACLAALIEHGIPPNFLAFVEPTNCQNFSSKTPESPNLTFPDPEIAEAVDKIIVNLGVKLFKGFVLDDWNISTENRVSEVVIISKSMSVSLGCKFIFIYAEKSISNKTFEAINKAGLVFDGRLVIDSRFCTNDPFIFAAGPLTKYSRKYQADHKNHIYYNAQEVGETIGRFFREMLIPESFKSFEKSSTKRTYPDGISKFESSLPDFHKPIVISCVLPGEIHYLSIATPGKHVPVELMMTSDDYGQLLVTGDYEHLERQGYFRLHVNRMHIVDSMCCLSKEPMDLNNLVNIWGKHVSLLNDLLIRFEMSMINDLFEFFKQPFLSGMVYDKFPSLMEEIRELFLGMEVQTDKTIADSVVEMLDKNNWKILNDLQNIQLRRLLHDSILVSEIEDKVLEYIQKNRIHLPMYAYPSLVGRLLRSHKQTPLFSK